jgi:hypothetical protein
LAVRRQQIGEFPILQLAVAVILRRKCLPRSELDFESAASSANAIFGCRIGGYCASPAAGDSGKRVCRSTAPQISVNIADKHASVGCVAKLVKSRCLT